jgi:hypothetical protein
MSSPPSPKHPAALDQQKLLAECEMRRQRRSGPGGQHRNTVETAVILTHQPTGVSAEASERRSQAENRRVALRRLRVNLAIEFRRPVNLDGSPSDLWRSRCTGGRIAVNPEHHDFPVLLAEVLDTLDAVDWEISRAAQWFGCTTSQVLKFLKLEPRAFVRLNRERQERGLGPLK